MVYFEPCEGDIETQLRSAFLGPEPERGRRERTESSSIRNIRASAFAFAAALVEGGLSGTSLHSTLENVRATMLIGIDEAERRNKSRDEDYRELRRFRSEKGHGR